MDLRPNRLLAFFAATAALAACGGGGGDAPASAGGQAFTIARVRAIHALADAPTLNVVTTQGVLAGGIEFKDATAFGVIGAGSTNVRVDAQLPGGLITLVPPRTLTFSTNDAYTFIVQGTAAAPSLLLIQEPITRVAAGSVRMRIAHAAPEAAAIDVYVSAPTAPLEPAARLGRIAFGEQTEPVTMPAGDYRLRATLANNAAAVVFDSGTVALGSAANLVVLAVPNTGTGSAPISLLAVADTSRFEIYDVAAPAALRMIHASPDSPAVDVVLDDDFAHPVLQDVPYRSVSGFLNVRPGEHTVKIVAANNPGAILTDSKLTLAAGQRYSVFATGPLSSLTAHVLLDDARSVSTAAKVRILHAAPSAGPLDIYFTGRGAGIAAGAPLARGVVLRADTGYVSLAGGSYDLTATLAGAKMLAIGPAPVTIADGGVYTAVMSDAVGGGSPLGLILFDGFAL